MILPVFPVYPGLESITIQHVLREVQILASLKHKNVLAILGIVKLRAK